MTYNVLNLKENYNSINIKESSINDIYKDNGNKNKYGTNKYVHSKN